MKSVEIKTLPLFRPLRSSLPCTNLRLSLRFSLFNRRSTTGATYIRRGKATTTEEERHKRATVRKTVTATIVLDPFILGTFVASLFAFAFLYVLRQSSSSKKNRRVLVSPNDAVSRKDDSGSGTDVIIVGAGVAGAALAHTLAKEGRRVHVIERDLSEQDRIVGELLQPGGYLKLIELGLEDCVKNIDAQRLVGYALFKDGKHTKLSYPLETFDSDVAGRGFHNGRFVQRIREKAASLPNVRLEQGIVTSLLVENGTTIKGVQYRTKKGDELRSYAPLTIVCDGCFSKLRRSLCKPKVDVPSVFVGLVLENCELPFENHGHVVLGDPSLILMYPISSSEVRCLVDVPGQKLPPIANGKMAKYLKTYVAPQVPTEVREAFIAAVEKDIVVLRDLLRPIRNLNDKEAVSKYMESFYTLRKPVASTINTLAEALYKVFLASSNEAKTELREACFDYLTLGGVCSSGPVALLSGLNPSPLSLVLHFFAVAIYAVGRLMLPCPTIKSVRLGARIILSASGIIIPIIKSEGVRQVFFPRTIAAIYRTPPQ
ncbi:PREDICTED: squalene epoxidase 2, mitochondrial-like isoform X2 [Camelina sativa]|uniref:Squalene monooxygenase n=1 Tax=Camelina sativa TaxID=90675 RepID=A0ABM0SW95_CAMSA|nr:PREDICTED: squalene epoxidase 2, mitochondrial-like isoform X2 [Camelina sativa]